MQTDLSGQRAKRPPGGIYGRQVLRDFQLFVRRVMEGSAGPSCRERKGLSTDQILEQLLEELLAGPKNRVLVTDEIGCGIVPAEPLSVCTGRRRGGSAAGLPGKQRKCGGCAAAAGMRN